MILTKSEIEEKKNEYMIIDDNFIDEKLLSDHFKKFSFTLNHKNIIAGQYFLYEKSLDEKIMFPKLGIYTNSYIIDQALELEWVNVRRTWEYNVEYIYSHDGNDYKQYVGELKSEFDGVILWNYDLFVYGIWTGRPTWKQLKPAYEKTLWYGRTKSEVRDIQIDRFLR